jgi:hypothetical protein
MCTDVWSKPTAILVALAAAACGTTSSTTVVAPMPDSIPFQVVDERPQSQRTSTRTILNEGVLVRFGDEAISPPPADLLKAWLAKQDSAAVLSGKTIRLTGFSLQVLDPAVQLSHSVESSYLAAATSPQIPTGAAVVGGLIGYGILSSRSGKTVKVQVTASVDGQPVSAESFRKFGGRVSEADINLVLGEALVLLAADVTAVAKGEQPRNHEWSTMGNRWPKRVIEQEQ